ncbi:MAG TPA: efflux RND transporter periplasmic adaptor subunit [Vicinamibacterales bacterium]|nr:efflux RND transporter periplasmic adaptor subunit [Vicinamibacterales bacterium]
MKTLVVLAVVIATTACGREPAPVEEQGPAAVVVGVATVGRRSLQETVSTAGQVVPAVSADWTIYAPQAAIIADLPRTVGEEVAAGDLLVRFEIAEQVQNVTLRQMAAADAAARADQARADVNRLSPLFEQGVVARNVIEAARAELSSAEAARKTADAYLEEARLVQETSRITARFDGLVAEVWKTPGEIATGLDTDPVLRVIDPTRLEVMFELPIEQALRVRESHPATVLTLTAGSFTALVTRRPVGMLVEASRAAVRLTAPELGTLALNDIVHVDLVLEERIDVLVVPIEAVQQDGTAAYVMTADADSVARRRPVRTGLSAGGFVQILEGLDEGQQVIVQGLTDVNDGTAILVGR